MKSVEDNMSSSSPNTNQMPGGFEVPSAYFDSFRQRMQNAVRHEAVKEELLGLNSFLIDIPKHHPFEVPSGYFETFERGMLQRISAVSEKSEPNKNRAFEIAHHILTLIFPAKLSPVYAAVFSVLFVAFLFNTPAYFCEDPECRLAQLTSTEIESYLLEEGYDPALDLFLQTNPDQLRRLENDIYSEYSDSENNPNLF